MDLKSKKLVKKKNPMPETVLTFLNFWGDL